MIQIIYGKNGLERSSNFWFHNMRLSPGELICGLLQALVLRWAYLGVGVGVGEGKVLTYLRGCLSAEFYDICYVVILKVDVIYMNILFMLNIIHTYNNTT